MPLLFIFAVDFYTIFVYNNCRGGGSMNPRRLCIAKLEEEGFVFLKNGGNHDKYYSKELKYTITVGRSHFDEDDMRMILQEVKRERKRQGK